MSFRRLKGIHVFWVRLEQEHHSSVLLYAVTEANSPKQERNIAAYLAVWQSELRSASTGLPPMTCCRMFGMFL